MEKTLGEIIQELTNSNDRLVAALDSFTLALEEANKYKEDKEEYCDNYDY